MAVILTQSWMAITVELIGGVGEQLWPYPDP
jgi:hypothetical protein